MASVNANTKGIRPWVKNKKFVGWMVDRTFQRTTIFQDKEEAKDWIASWGDLPEKFISIEKDRGCFAARVCLRYTKGFAGDQHDQTVFAQALAHLAMINDMIASKDFSFLNTGTPLFAPMTLAEAIDYGYEQWRVSVKQATRKNGSYVRRWWVANYGAVPVGVVTDVWLTRVRDRIVLELGQEAAAIRLKFLRRWWDKARKPLALENPWPEVDVPPCKDKKVPEDKFLTSKQFSKFMELLIDPNRPWHRLEWFKTIIVMFVETGCRRNELLLLQWPQINWKTQSALITNRKNKKDLRVRFGLHTKRSLWALYCKHIKTLQRKERVVRKFSLRLEIGRHIKLTKKPRRRVASPAFNPDGLVFVAGKSAQLDRQITIELGIKFNDLRSLAGGDFNWKSKTVRGTRLSDETAHLLEIREMTRNCGPDTDRPTIFTPMPSFEPLNNSWRQLVKAAGVPHLTLHCLRHTAARQIEEEFGPAAAADFIGDLLRTYLRTYHHMEDERTIAARIDHVNRLDSLMDSIATVANATPSRKANRKPTANPKGEQIA